MSYLGIDIGTTGTKAAVFDETGRILSSAYMEYSLSSPQQGWFELDPGQVVNRCLKVITDAAGKVRKTDPVQAIGIASQGEAFTLLDGNDNYLCNAMVSFDTRSSGQVKSFCKSFGREELYKITGHSPHTLFSLFKLLWLKENKPELLKKTSKLLCMGDLIRYKLTGNSVTSFNLASRTMLFDVSSRQWSDKLIEQVGISKEVLPTALPSGQSAGILLKNMAEETGLERNVTVATGGHDQCCGALGVGVIQSGIAAYSLGTVECITPAFETCVLNEKLMNGNLATYPHTVQDLYTTVAFCMTGGSGLKWFKENLGRYELQKAEETGGNVYDILIDQIPSDPTSLLVLPHYTSTGTPYFEPSPLGAVLGLNLSTTKGELLKALLEGISFEMKVNLELLKKCGISVKQLRAFGGGTASDAWMQIKADILDMPIECVETKEAGCMGAAMLAALAAERISSLDQCCQEWVKTNRQFTPKPENVKIYAQSFEVYKDLYSDLSPLREKMNNLLSHRI